MDIVSNIKERVHLVLMVQDVQIQIKEHLSKDWMTSKYKIWCFTL